MLNLEKNFVNFQSDFRGEMRVNKSPDFPSFLLSTLVARDRGWFEGGGVLFEVKLTPLLLPCQIEPSRPTPKGKDIHLLLKKRLETEYLSKEFLEFTVHFVPTLCWISYPYLGTLPFAPSSSTFPFPSSSSFKPPRERVQIIVLSLSLSNPGRKTSSSSSSSFVHNLVGAFRAAFLPLAKSQKCRSELRRKKS